MNPWQIVLLVVLVVMLAAVIALYFLGKRAQKKKDEQDAQLAAAAQTVTMLIIDKKMMRMKDAGLPEALVAQSNWLAKNSKVPVVKAKVGPQIMNLICDDAIYDEIPVRKEVKATVSGIYITKVKGLHGKNTVDKTTKTKGFRAWAMKVRRKYDQQ